MKLILTIDNVPNKESQQQLQREFRDRRLPYMQFCRKYGIADLYEQFRLWLRGGANQKQYGKFVEALLAEGIITETNK